MALVGAAGGLGSLAMVTAGPEPGNTAGLVVGEDTRAVDNARCRRIGDRDLDHIDGEERGFVVTGQTSDTAGELFFRTDRTGAGIIDDDGILIAGDH